MPEHGYCECGCGERTALITESRPSRGLVKGRPRRFVRGHGVNVRWAGRGPEYVEDDRGYKTPCWVWQRALDDKGYANVQGGKAYRVYYERAKGPVPEGLHLDHLCRQRDCVNPDHLEAVTQAENNRRSYAARLAGSWSLKYERCVECGGTEQRHYAKGLCRRCYKRFESRARRRVHA